VTNGRVRTFFTEHKESNMAKKPTKPKGDKDDMKRGGKGC
jgi:hypothetical protein